MGHWIMLHRLEPGLTHCSSPGTGLSWLLLLSPWLLPPSVYGINLGADAGMVGDEHPRDIPRGGMVVAIIAPGCQFAWRMARHRLSFGLSPTPPFPSRY